MFKGSRPGVARVVRSALGAVATVVLVAILALPAAAVTGPTKLLDPAVSPRSGTPTTTFAFSVVYRNREGSPPDKVTVVIGGAAHPMSSSGTSWKAGVRFSYSTRLAAGSYAVVFNAIDREKFTDQVAAGSVSVQLPPPPTPAPTPTPKPTPKPTSGPTPTPQPVSAPSPSAAPTAPASAPPSLQPTTNPDPRDGPGWTGGTTIGGSSADPAASDPPSPGDGSIGESGDLSTGEDPAVGGADAEGLDDSGADVADGAVETRGWGELTRYLEALGVDSSGVPTLRLLPAFVGTVGGVAMLMAFLFFGKRRRDGEPPEPDEVLSAAASRGPGVVADGALVPAGGPGAGPMNDELAMPRWRRPSLLEARKADPRRTVTEAMPLTFAQGVVGPVDGHERRLIRYHVVQLLDAPDELRSAEIGALAQGDEVQLMQRSGSYWLVLCPDGRQGWIHKMTLGAVVGESTAPSARDAWSTPSVEAEDVDDDVLAAFMAARGRA